MSKQDRKDRYFGDGARLDGTHAGTCPDGRLLPDGIERLTEEALCAERLMPEGGARLGDASSGKVKVAAFDFDGTCLNGSSPKKLVTTLSRKKLLSPYNVFRAGLWGLAYKLNLPKDPEGVRQRVFSAFEGCAASNVNDFLCRFYHERIAQLYRPDADASMVAHLEAGHAVVLISASFEPIIASAMVAHPIPIAISTRMSIDGEGRYTGKIEGLPTEGPEKIVVLRKFLDEYYGAGKWELGWAYGDHYSDLDLLSAAEHPCAVTPDAKLRRHAEECGWDVLDWN